MSGTVDLHLHTNFSDGTKSPSELLNIVRKKKLSAFSICDHDNIEGYFKTRAILAPGDPELVPGVELSAGSGTEDIHIIGYYFDPESEILKSSLEKFRELRNRRGLEMLNKLKALGIELSYDKVREIAGDSAIGRPNVADALHRAGYVNSFDEAFQRYIGFHGPAYVPKKNLTPPEAIELIHDAGGLAVLAHPGIGNAGKHIEEFIRYGLDGIEAYHPNHSRQLQKNYLKYAEKHGLLATGGSDYHGREGRYGKIDCMKVPEELWKKMKDRHTKEKRGQN